MKRAFVYQSDRSHKFWQIQYSGTEFVVNSGKVNTNGRSGIKQFHSEEECIKQAEKLIAQKLKKGYIETDVIDDNDRLYFDDSEVGLHRKTSHPRFANHFAAEFYYDCGDEDSPFGNDEGSDTLHSLEEQMKKKGLGMDVDAFPQKLIELDWDMLYVAPDQRNEEELKQLLAGPPLDGIANDMLLLLNDQVIVAAAFGQIKITGNLCLTLGDRALRSLERMQMTSRLMGYESKNTTLEEMANDLRAFGIEQAARTARINDER
ncbi:MAG: WGR domain-containing protein [Candidatus Pristimantibacillus sp.]